MSASQTMRSRLTGFLSKDSGLSHEQQQEVLKYLMRQSLNILVVGPTGAGKSSTINALFDTQNAVVGSGVNPMTMDVRRYDLGNLVLWDSPGLGDGVEEDIQHKKKIIQHLKKTDENNNYVVDLVLVVLDGSSREMSTSYELINEVVIPNLGESPKKRILVAINQADLAYKGTNGWDYELNAPTEISYKFLDEKVNNVRARIESSTGIDIEPVYCCAGYQGDVERRAPFNLGKLLYMIVDRAPIEKRLLIRENISKKEEVWKASDRRKDYAAATRESIGFIGIVGALVKGFFGLFS